MPASTGIAPASRSAPKIVYALESRTWPNSGVSVGGINSSPVESTIDARTRMHERRGDAGVREQPELGRRRGACPPGRGHRPRATSSPTGRTWRPGRRGLEEAAPARRTPRRSRPARRVGPAGIGAPVAICTASPSPTVDVGSVPDHRAARRCFSSPGTAGVAPATSAARTANPSIADEANAGRSCVATTSSASDAAVRVGQRQLERGERLDLRRARVRAHPRRRRSPSAES